jgi:hypothetical protein
MDPNNPLVSADANISVWAGLASDPFFFNLAGFQTMAGTVAAVAPTLTAANVTAAGCPIVGTGAGALTAADVTLLDTELTSGYDGGVPIDDFNLLNVNTIVIQIDGVNEMLLANSPVTSGAPTDTFLSVWASTNNQG